MALLTTDSFTPLFPLVSKTHTHSHNRQSELCRDSAVIALIEFNVGDYSYRENDLRSLRRDIGLFFGFCVTLKSKTNTCMESDVE